MLLSLLTCLESDASARIAPISMRKRAWSSAGCGNKFHPLVFLPDVSDLKGWVRGLRIPKRRKVTLMIAFVSGSDHRRARKSAAPRRCPR